MLQTISPTPIGRKFMPFGDNKCADPLGTSDAAMTCILDVVPHDILGEICARASVNTLNALRSTSRSYKTQLDKFAHARQWTVEDILDQLRLHYATGWKGIAAHLVNKACAATGDRLESIKACITLCQIRECGRALWETRTVYADDTEWNLLLRCFFTLALSGSQHSERSTSIEIYKLEISTLQAALAAWW